ncbi:unnamed protein product [Effrenium voratum]|nr:unnamed protein product [Effrenium voratum]
MSRVWVPDPLQDTFQESHTVPGNLMQRHLSGKSGVRNASGQQALPKKTSSSARSRRMCDQIVHLLASLAFGNRSLQLISGSRYAQYLAMSEKLYRAIKSQVRAVHDELEDWIFEAFREGGLPECESDEEQDLKEEVAQRRRGMRYFAAGRPRDRKQFASMLFPIFQGDPNEQLYQEAFHDILRVAGTSVKAKSRHKLSFGISVLFFTAGQGNLYGVVASGDFPTHLAFEFLEEMLEVYESIDVACALDQADETLWSEKQFVQDAFGVRELAVASWKKRIQPGDGSLYTAASTVKDKSLEMEESL